MTTSISRFQLQNLNPTLAKERELALEEERKAKTLDFLVNHYKPTIMKAAKEGKSSYTVSERDYHRFRCRHPPSCPAEEYEFYFYKQIRDNVFTHNFADKFAGGDATELTEAFRKVFPDCTITRKLISEQIHVDLYAEINEITIDWS